MALKRKQGLVAFAATFLLFFWTVAPPAAAQSMPEGTVVGTVHVHKNVELARAGETWVRVDSATALAEETGVRTGEGGAAYLDLGPEGGIGLYPETHVQVGRHAHDGLALRLERGEIAFRIPSRSRLQISTSTARVQTSAVVRIADLDGDQIEGSIRLEPSGETHMEVHHGSIMVKGEGDATFTTVRAGEAATIAAGEGARIVPAQAVQSQGMPAGQAAAKQGARGIFSWLPSGSPLAALTVTVIGGTLGGLAASGAFDGSSTGSPKGPPPDAPPDVPPGPPDVPPGPPVTPPGR